MAGAPALSNVAAIWLSVSRVLTVLTELAPDQLFAADVTIWGPGATRRSLPGAIKSVLDGVVAACHRHDGTDASELAYRVGADPTEVLGLLTRPAPAVSAQTSPQPCSSPPATTPNACAPKRPSPPCAAPARSRRPRAKSLAPAQPGREPRSQQRPVAHCWSASPATPARHGPNQSPWHS